MTSVGVALVNGVRVPGYLFAPGFVGDGSQLRGVHTSNVTLANTGRLAYYVNPTTIGGNPGLSFENSTLTVNGNLYVSGSTVSSNNVAYENSILSIGTGDFDAFTKGVLFTNSRANVMISYTNVLTIGYTHNSASDVKLFPADGEKIQLNVLGTVNADAFVGDAAFLSNTCDVEPGTYGDGLHTPQITIGSSGRPNSINVVAIQSSLESVTSFGTTTSKSIQFENEKVSLTTTGNVGVSNVNPTSLLCVGRGVQITDTDVSLTGSVRASRLFGNGAALTRTTDAQFGTYGDSLNTPQITIDKDGRLSQIDHIPIRLSLDSVTRNGSTSKSTIQLEHAPISLTTTGKVGISNRCPDALLCVGSSTRFDESDLFMRGNVNAVNFFGNASSLTNTSDVKPGVYGGGSIVPQIWVDGSGRISDIQVTNIFMTLDQVTQFNSSTNSTIYIKNKSTGLVSDGDITIRCGKNLTFLDTVCNPLCTVGQRSAEDSKTLHISSTKPDGILNMSNWKKVLIESGINAGYSTMKGCWMEPGTGCVLNAQQLSKTPETLIVTASDLFKWFSFCAPDGKNVRVPDPTACQAGSWIGFTNTSKSFDVNILDVFGTVVYTVLKKCEYAGGTSCRLMCVSTMASANGFNVMGDVWVVA
jgi:hypothetical protein